MFLIFILIFMAGLCWGSFLNVVACRILHEKPFFAPRSMCPECNHIIAFYDNIPLISWCLLRGACRECKAPISVLYPFIELITACVITGLFYQSFAPPVLSMQSMTVPFIFFSALIVSTRTDLEAMVIPQCFSLWLVPLGMSLAALGMSDISVIESIIGSVMGYGVLWLIAYSFKRYTGQDGMGEGDMELLAMIGSFIGPIGVWASLMIASFSGLILGILYLFFTHQKRSSRIPFGPFLALGAAGFLFFKNYIVTLFLA